MLFSQTAEYALRAMVHLAADPELAQTTQQIAERTKVPLNYLSKLLQILRRAGLVDARRGVGGGFALSRDPATISVLDVLNVIDPLERIHTCPLGLPEHADELCGMHRCLDEALAHLEKTFASTMIADLVGGGKAGPFGGHSAG